MKKLYFLLCFSLLGTQAVWSQWPAAGGPDNYGYEWKTNQDENGPTYEWIDITGVGTEVAGLTDDNVIGPIAMNMDFQYYWNTHSQVWIGSNGYLAFQSGNIASTGIGFPPTPSISGPNDVIAPFMCDLTAAGIGNTGKVYYFTDNQNSRFVVSYIDIPFWEDPAVNPNEYAGSNSFQVILDASDSTITFQYQNQVGSWNSSYDTQANPMVVGIENVTGNIGLLVSNNVKPIANSAITFYPPKETSFVIGDVAPISIQTANNTASFVPYSSSALPQTKLSAKIGNLGNIDISFPTEVLGRVRDSTGQLFFQQQISVPTLARGEIKEVNFTAPFIPLSTGPYTFSIELSNPADINSGNNVRTVELVAVDTSMSDVALSYASGNLWNIANPNTGSTINWTGGEGSSGAAVLYEFYGYPLIVKSLDFLVSTFQNANPTQGFIAEIYEVDPTGAELPGRLLFRQEVPIENVLTDGNWTTVDLSSTPVVIAENGFYVSWIQLDPQIVLFEELVPPISQQTYEILDGNWAQYRNNSTNEPWIRATVDISNIIITDVKDKFDALNRFDVFPNPTSGKVQLDLELNQAAPLAIKILDMQGRKVKLDMVPNTRYYQQTYDLSYLPKGVYLIQISTADGQQTKKVILK